MTINTAISATAWFAAGLATLLLGAELILRGGVRLAAQLGIPPIIIGLTVVAVGTSAPELAVGIEAALRDNGSFAVANIAGTNIVNLLLILGLSALLKPLALTMQTLRFDLPVMTVAALWLATMAADGTLTRMEGSLMLGAAVLYTGSVLWFARRESANLKREFAREYPGAAPDTGAAFLSGAILLVVGIAIVVAGSDWLVDGATSLAQILAVPDEVIALTVVAVGTSAPELATTIIGTLRNDRDIAIGNLLGSSIYNILVILGVTCVVPLGGLSVAATLIRFDIPVMVLVTCACIPVFLSGRQVSRLEGGLFVAAYAAYVTAVLK